MLRRYQFSTMLSQLSLSLTTAAKHADWNVVVMSGVWVGVVMYIL